MTSITDIVPPGVVTGDNLLKLLEHARDNGYAIPAVNCTRLVKFWPAILIYLIVCNDKLLQ